jgi:hypothetical protein
MSPRALGSDKNVTLCLFGWLFLEVGWGGLEKL